MEIFKKFIIQDPNISITWIASILAIKNINVEFLYRLFHDFVLECDDSNKVNVLSRTLVPLVLLIKPMSQNIASFNPLIDGKKNENTLRLRLRWKVKEIPKEYIFQFKLAVSLCCNYSNCKGIPKIWTCGFCNCWEMSKSWQSIRNLCYHSFSN